MMVPLSSHSSSSPISKLKLYYIGLASTISVALYSLIFIRRKSSSSSASSAASNNINNKSQQSSSSSVVVEKWNGINNMGATCYLNSLLQSLFHIRVLRKAIWDAHNSNNRIIKALQSTFYHLQFGDSSVNTQKLLDSFGWSSSDAYVQHDIQELARMLIEKIEEALTKKNVKSKDEFNLISKLFKGQFEIYTSCLHVNFTSTRREDFYDVQLTVTPSVYESLRHFVKPDLLMGDNRYFANDQLGLQDAKRGIRFVSFPPVLFIHLKRFEVSMSGAQRKINARCEFTNDMDLKEFVIESEQSEDWNYTLQSVLIHSGSVNGGHYTCISNVSQNPDKKRWILFDDEHAKEIPEAAVFEPNFGTGIATKSAYMLVYIRNSLYTHVMCDVDKSMIKPQLIERIERESSTCALL